MAAGIVAKIDNIPRRGLRADEMKAGITKLLQGYVGLGKVVITPSTQEPPYDSQGRTGAFARTPEITRYTLDANCERVLNTESRKTSGDDVVARKLSCGEPDY